ncbi:MAG: alpha/beta hydrolase fold domain-containing protein [Schaedlerella sp.]|nr:alpha/beta hydrolase fold domain-containing protein [Schaedlerella sp.]
MKKYNIPSKKINKEVRLIGSAIRAFSPAYSEKIFHMQNKMLDKFMKGHWLSLSTKVKTCYVTRKDGTQLRLLVCFSKKKKEKKPVAFHMPLYPMLDDREQTASSQNNDAPVWNTQSNRLSWKLYLSGMKRNIPYYAAPSRATDLSGMPACCTYVGTL